MGDSIRLVGPNQAVEILGVKLVGVTAENGKKLLFTLAFIALLLLLNRVARALARRALAGRHETRVAFWARQAVHLATAVVLVLGLVSIWFDNPARLAGSARSSIAATLLAVAGRSSAANAYGSAFSGRM